MTITMTSKHQITLPKKIIDALNLEQGALFDVAVKKDHIELIPLEATKREFTDEEFSKLENIFQKERSKSKKVTRSMIGKLKQGRI